MIKLFMKFWKKKVFGLVGIAALLSSAIIYLWTLFVKQNGVLEFNKTDSLFLFMIAVMGLFICGIVAYLVFDRDRQIKSNIELNAILTEILLAINEHDTNDILFQKITQDIIVKLHSKIIDGKDGISNEGLCTVRQATEEIYTI